MSFAIIAIIGLIAIVPICQVQSNDNDQSETAECPGFPWSEMRLPTWITPLHYELQIRPNLTEEQFVGRVSIEFYVNQSTQVIVFHAKELQLQNIVLNNRSVIARHQCDQLQQIALRIDAPYQLGDTDHLNITFSGNFSDSLTGLYSSTYKTSTNEERRLAVTQFEATEARRMFPCWDEPAFKAEFSLSIIRTPDLISISNMPIQSIEVFEQHWRIDRFSRTVKMSTYLLALVICDFQSVKRETKSGVEISVYAPAERINQTITALEAAVDALEYVENFVNVKYPLKKLDLIAVEDFAAGAMENFGLATFQDHMLLLDPKTFSIKEEELSASVITHEIAHQWFGNLVTMKWWSELWLKEGFARFMENFVTSRIRPEWNLISTFVAHTTRNALYTDALNKTHAVFANVEDPEEIENSFDAITYDKGAAIIYMIMTVVGEERMTEGLHEYLTTYQYSNADGNDLWSILTKHVPNIGGLTLTEVAKTWISQPGYPMINVTYRDGMVTVTQSRFVFLRETQYQFSNQLWHVPVTVITDVSLNEPSTFWLKSTKQDNFPLPSEFSWLKVNVNGTGFYRVLYDKENWKAIAKQLQNNHTVYSPSDRSLLLDDAFAFLLTGYVDVETAFELLKYFPKERNAGPIKIVLTHLVNLERRLFHSNARRLYRKYVASLLTEQYERIGWAVPKARDDRSVQSILLSAACQFNVADCNSYASNLFWNWRNQNTEIPEDHFALATSAAVFKADRAWVTVLDLYKNATDAYEKLIYLQALTFSKYNWRLVQLLRMALNSDVILPKDLPLVLSQVAANPVGHYLAWRFISGYWSKINQLVKERSVLDKVIKSGISHVSDKSYYLQITQFYQNLNQESAKATIRDTLELVKINMQWAEFNEESLMRWLRVQRFQVRS